MSYPTFETREELQAWEKGEVRRFQAAARSASVAGGLITGMIKVANRIERVRDAHAHLLGDHTALTQAKDTTDDA